MTHTKEPWEVIHTDAGLMVSVPAIGKYGRPLLTTPRSDDPARAVVCVNAMAGIRAPEAWVKAAKRVQELAVKSGFPVELAEALLDMRESEG